MNTLLRKISKKLKEQYDAKEVIIFGSYARNVIDENSDIDILVISETKERFFERQATVKRLMRDLKKKIPISPIVLTPQEVENRKNRGDQFIEEILKTGIRA